MASPRLVALAAAVGLVAGGCASEPAAQRLPPGAASVRLMGSGPQGLAAMRAYGGNSRVDIRRVDGVDHQYPPAIIPGVLWNPKSPLLVVSGRHRFAITVSKELSEPGPLFGFDRLVHYAGATEIEADLRPNSAYRITSQFLGSGFELTLWDETPGPGEGTKVQTWQIPCQ